MNINNFLLTCALTFLLCACGGSGGSNSNGIGGGDITASNSGNNTEIVFGDSLNSSWGRFTAYEWSNTLGTGKNYEDGQTSNFLQWKIVQAASSEHGSVVEVSYAQQDLRWAQFYITPTTPVDLSRFETGKFSFDINVLDWGDAYDSNTGTGTFEVRVECGWPCASHAFNVVIGNSNEWQHVEINAADFASSGADLTKLDGTFLIKPIIGKQKGTRYQLDNIKWTKGATAAVKKKIVFEEHFNTYASKDAWVFLQINGMTPFSMSFISDGLLISTSATGNYYDSWALERTLNSSINIDHKKVKIQFNPDSSLTHGIANIELVATDANGYIAYTPGIYLNSFQAQTWNQVSFDVDTAGIGADNLFDPTAVKKLKIIFNSNAQPFNIANAGGAGWIEMDEFIITE